MVQGNDASEREQRQGDREAWVDGNISERRNCSVWSRDEVQEEGTMLRANDWLVLDPISLNKEPIMGDRRVTGVGLDSS